MIRMTATAKPYPAAGIVGWALALPAVVLAVLPPLALAAWGTPAGVLVAGAALLLGAAGALAALMARPFPDAWASVWVGGLACLAACWWLVFLLVT